MAVENQIRFSSREIMMVKNCLYITISRQIGLVSPCSWITK